MAFKDRNYCGRQTQKPTGEMETLSSYETPDSWVSPILSLRNQELENTINKFSLQAICPWNHNETRKGQKKSENIKEQRISNVRAPCSGDRSVVRVNRYGGDHSGIGGRLLVGHIFPLFIVPRPAISGETPITRCFSDSKAAGM